MSVDEEEGIFPLSTFLDFDLDSPQPGRYGAGAIVGDAHLNPTVSFAAIPQGSRADPSAR